MISSLTDVVPVLGQEEVLKILCCASQVCYAHKNLWGKYFTPFSLRKYSEFWLLAKVSSCESFHKALSVVLLAILMQLIIIMTRTRYCFGLMTKKKRPRLPNNTASFPFHVSLSEQFDRVTPFPLQEVCFDYILIAKGFHVERFSSAKRKKKQYQFMMKC